MLSIGDLKIENPIIQGGMAIRASMAKLAAAVANEGGIGVIAGTALSIDELKKEIKKAKDMIVNKGGALGVNIMYATTDFMDLVHASIEAGIVTEDLAQNGKSYKTSEVGQWIADYIKNK